MSVRLAYVRFSLLQPFLLAISIILNGFSTLLKLRQYYNDSDQYCLGHHSVLVETMPPVPDQWQGY